jgi:phospholipase/carboxylesterase
MSPTTFAAPVVARRGSSDPAAPLVVLLHGRGSSEDGIIGLAEYLPQGLAYAAVRAPIGEGGGFAWFANRGIGRPVAGSLSETMAWFRGWLDAEAQSGRPVILVGFSGGAAFAGGLVLADPQRYAGAAILYGTLPFDAGVPVTPGRLFGLPTLVAQGDQDHVIPRDLLDRTWEYLLAESGSATTATRDPGGHGLSAATAQQLSGWIAHRLRFIHERGRTTVAPQGRAPWPTLPGGELPERKGARPDVSWSIPQQQVSDNAPVALQEKVFAYAAGLSGVIAAPSQISVPGARAFTLAERRAPEDAFLVPQVGEFAHLHPAHDGSMHLALPVELAAEAVRQGWARPHMWAGVRLSAGFVMVFGPRDEDELAVGKGILAASHAYATGALEAAAPSGD